MPSIRLFIGEVSGRKPHIFKDRHGIWRVIPARRSMTLWEKLCDDEFIHIFAFSIHQNYNRFFAQTHRKYWNDFAYKRTYDWNLKGDFEYD